MLVILVLATAFKFAVEDVFIKIDNSKED